MPILITKKRSWLSYTALYLLLSCNRQDITVNLDPVTDPKQDTITQEGESLHISLHQAVLEGNIELVRILLPTVYVNTPDSQGNTLLHLAVQQDNLDLVRLLVEAQADIHAKNTAGLSPLEIANQKGNPPIIKELAAVSRNSISLVKLLLDWNYEDIGEKRILRYLSMKDKGHLRESCVEMGWKLLEKDIFRLNLTPDRLQDMRLQDYPRLYLHVQHAHSITFQPVPADAIVQNVGDLQRIVGDSRFTIKGVAFKGEHKYLAAVHEALPGPLKESLLLSESLSAAHSDSEPFDKQIVYSDDEQKYSYQEPTKYADERPTEYSDEEGPTTVYSDDEQEYFYQEPTKYADEGPTEYSDEEGPTTVYSDDEQEYSYQEPTKYADDEFISGLITALKDQDSNVRSSAADAAVRKALPGPLKESLLLPESLAKEEATEVSRWLGALQKLHYSYATYDSERTVDALVRIGTPEVISGLLTTLKDEYVGVRIRAADTLVKIGTPEVISGLLTALKDQDVNVRISAASALGKLKASTPEAIGGLLIDLKDQDKYVRRSAASALGKLQVSTPEVISGLLTALKDQASSVRRRAAEALVELKANTPEVISGWLTALKDQNRYVRISAAGALGEIKPSTPEVISGLLTALKDQDVNVESSAAKALVKLKANTPEVISDLLTALKNQDGWVRRRGADMLKELKVNTPEIISGLLIALKDKDVKSNSVEDALKEIKASTPEAISGPLIALQDKNWQVRISAVKALGNLKASTPEVISGLLTALKDKDWEVKSSAAYALGSIKASTPEVISGLLKALKKEWDQALDTRRNAAYALVKLEANTPEVISGWLTALKATNNFASDVKMIAASALGELKANTPDVISGLLTALRDKDSGVRSSVAEALVKLKANTPEVISGLLTALKNESYGESYARSRAASALGKLKANTPEVISGLLTALKDKSDQASEVRRIAASALGELKANTPEVISGLLTALKEGQESGVRSSAAEALGEIDMRNPEVDRQAAIVGLFSTLQNKQENADVRNSSADALDKMRDYLPQEQLKDLADYYYDRLDYEKAAGGYSKLLKLTKDKKGTEDYAVPLARTIEAYLKTDKQENLYKAQNYFVEAEFTFNKLNELKRENLLSELSEQTSLLFSDLLINIGSFYFKILSYPVAEKYFKSALRNLETIPNKEKKVEYLNLLHKQGLLALAKGNTSGAIQKFEEAQNCYEKLEKSEKGVRAYIDICEGMIKSYLELNELNKAYKLCEKVIEMIGSLGGESLASFDHSIKMLLNIMGLQLEAADTPEKKELVGLRLKNLLYNPNPEQTKEVLGLQEVVDRLGQFKPEVHQALIDCYSEIDVMEANRWIKESVVKQKVEDSKLRSEEKYYVQATLLNSIATSRNVQNGRIDISVTGHGKKALCKETWESFNESEKQEVRRDPKVESLDLASLTSRTQENIRDLVQENIKKAVRYVYLQSKNEEIRKITLEEVKGLLEEVACILSEGIIKTKSRDQKDQHASLMRKHDSQNFPYTKTGEPLQKAFEDFCEGMQVRLSKLPQDPQEKILRAKETAAWIEYRMNLTDHFYGEESSKVAGVLAAYVCALADSKMPIFLSKDDYLKGAPNTIREEGIQEDEKNLPFMEWEYYYGHKFPSDIRAQDIAKPEEKGKPIDYYLAEANQNLERISKLIGSGTLSTTSDASKKAALREEYTSDLLSAKIEADFAQEMERLYQAKDQKFKDDNALATFVKEIAYNLLKSNIKIDAERKDLDIFREGEKGNEKWRIRSNFSLFIKELRELLPKVESGEISVKYLGALIHYRVSMTGRFFKDGNRRIALALETFMMMRYNHGLPLFSNEEDWKIAAPAKFKDEEALEYLNDVREDARFLKWYYKYSSLFSSAPEWRPTVEKLDPKDPWKVMVQGSLTRALERDYTVYNESNIFQDPTRLRECVDKTGIEVKKLAVFDPRRILLHQAIAAVITRVALPYGDEEGKKLKEIVSGMCKRIEDQQPFQTFAEEMPQRYKAFKGIVSRKIQRNVQGAKEDQYSNLISNYTTLLSKHYEVSKKRMRLADEQEALSDLVSWELLKREYQKDIEGMVDKGMVLLEKEKETNGIAFLTMKTGYERDIWVLAGGPASGKTSIFNAKLKAGLVENNNVNACTINPDIFKPLLLPLGADYHAARTHEESSYVKDLVLEKLEHLLDKTEKAPTMVLDVVNPDLKKFAAILKDNPKISLYTTTCPVTDEVVGKKVELINDVEVIKEVTIPGSITRAFYRASKEFDDKGEKNPDYGRYVPSGIVLEGHKKVTESFPGFINSGRYSLIELYDNTTRDSKQVCHMEGKALRIDNFNSFIEFLKKRYINTKAYSEGMVYNSEYLSEGLLKPEHVASAVAEYLKTGIKMNYQQHMSWDNGLTSRNLGFSLVDLTKDLGDGQRAASIFEALALDILSGYNLKEEFPIKLKEIDENGLSIFSNDIEREGYLPKGSVFRFLRSVNSIILKQKGMKVSDVVLNKVSREVLKTMIAKELPREEEKLIKYLPPIIESALSATTKKT